ncbi:response regulator transcription factor [Neobacillus bataviensis]|uniref:response regulator transcription factor n=1 Tax=Neobacillus bataviensis TaxID=220685 RepID=UPI001CBFD442|nr:response regulator [Neobacillus bataviensis]
MHKAVIVDDEIFFRQGLKSLIDWKSCGFDVVADASNGEDALAIIHKIKPDLVVTDIRMPVLDGLELIKQLKQKEGHHPKFIIISGHSDFKYAQQAVRYGVHDFILKPIDQEEVEGTLKSLSKSVTEQKIMFEKDKELKKAIILDNLIFGMVDEREVNELSSDLSLEDVSEYYYMVVEVNGLPLLPGDAECQLKEKLTNIIRDIQDTRIGVLIQDLGQGSYGVIIPATYLKRFQMQIAQFAHWTYGLLTKCMNQKITFFIGSAVPKLHLIRNSYETAQEIRQYKYTQEEQNIFLYHEFEKNRLITYTELEDSYYHLLMEHVEENTTISIMETIDKIFLQFSWRRMAKAAVLASITRCVHSILKIIKNMDGDESQLKTFQNMLYLQNYNVTLQQLRKLFLEYVLESKEYIVILRKQSANGEANKIKQFVDLHYRENISLKTIAAKFYMNPVYLGQLFKKAYGIYFKDYLLQVRISEAKKLLRQTEMKIYEIAESVGFNNTDYFVTIFGRLEKITPTEYRHKLHENRKVR